MGKKAQQVMVYSVALMVVLGLVILILTSMNTSSSNNLILSDIKSQLEGNMQFSDSKEDIENVLDNCMDESLISAMEDNGIRESTKKQFESQMTEKIAECTAILFAEYRQQGFDIKSGELSVELSFSDEIITAKITYPILLEKKTVKIDFNDFSRAFDRTVLVNLPKEINSPVMMISNDHKAVFRLMAGTKLSTHTDKLGVKIEDLHFDGLSNSVALGNLIYSGLYDGTSFDKPVEISIQSKLIKEGEDISISWWDEAYSIWRALDTKIKDDTAYAQAMHFTKFALTQKCSGTVVRDSGDLFIQRYSPCSQYYWKFISKPKIIAKSSGDVYESSQISEKITFGKSGCSPSISIPNIDGKTSISMQAYPDPSCVGGSVEDGNGDNSIYSLSFLPKGDACIKSWDYEVACTPDDNCIAPPNTFSEKPGSNLEIQVGKFIVENSNGDACASGSIKFTIQASGII